MAVTSAKFAEDGSGTNNANYTPATNPQVGIRYGRNYNGINIRRAYNNTAYTTQKFGRKRSWTLNYTHLNTTDKGKLEALFEHTVGQLNSFHFSEDGTNYSYEVRFTQSALEFTEVAYNVFSTQLSFEEL
jgi:hypothetical protein|tara:strand:+ start:574 stop:963 length:390 start_codon:yes stop_codon:yes gene_type:complete